LVSDPSRIAGVTGEGMTMLRDAFESYRPLDAKGSEREGVQMLKRIRRLPSPALVISIIALVVAVGGGTFAIALNKHDTKKIVNKQIEKKAPKLSVKRAEKADKAKVAKPIGPAGGDLTGTYPDPLIADGAVGNAKLADDSVSASKLGGTQQVVGAAVQVNGPGNGTASVTCPAGTQVLSGGGGASSFLVFGVESFQSGNGWLWVARNSDNAPHTIFATAVCLNTP
jgi:hypothetical protein